MKVVEQKTFSEGWEVGEVDVSSPFQWKNKESIENRRKSDFPLFSTPDSERRHDIGTFGPF
mgnify:CR=1 FL=1